MTADAVQRQLGVEQPDFGVLFQDMRIPDGGELAMARLLQPKAEAEVAFVLAQDLDDPATNPESMAAATDYVVAAIEIVDSRISDWKITFADTVADNGSSAFFVLGKDRTAIDDLDLARCAMVLDCNGVTVSTGFGAACLGHPLNAAAWLARQLAMNGTPLRRGDIILSGALGPMVAIAPGDRLTARIDGLGEVAVSFGTAR